MLVVVWIGLAMLLCATLAMPWPSDLPGEGYRGLDRHWERLLAAPAPDAETTVAATPPLDWLWRRAWDALHYFLLLAGVGLAAWASFSIRPAPWIGLMAVGVLGVLYTAGLVLYNGPLVATPGYLLVLFGSAFNALIGPVQGR
jgi:hypothetical protein